MQSAWWSPLHELSNPLWKSTSEVAPSRPFQLKTLGKALFPTKRTLQGLGDRFNADWARWWLMRHKKPAKLLSEWNKKATELTSSEAHSLEPRPKLQRVIELAVERNQPIWVEGNSSPSDFFDRTLDQSRQPRMFTSLSMPNEVRSVLEFGFPIDRGSISERDRELYLNALQQLRNELSRHIYAFDRSSDRLVRESLVLPENAQSHPRSPMTGDSSIANIVELASILEACRADTIKKIEGKLNALEGVRLDTLQSNQLLAKSLHQLLDGHGFRIKCTECGQPAIMRCLVAGNSPTGSFVFDHYLSRGRTFHGGRSSIPKLSVIAKLTRQTSTMG